MACHIIEHQVSDVCDSFTWNDSTYFQSGTYSYLTTNAVGCDSIANLHLTIIYSTSFDTIVNNACNSFTWNDSTYFQSGTYTYLTTNAVGCDSTANLHLTVNYSSTGVDTQTHCDSYTWIDGNTYTSSNNVATFTLTNSVGCDSLITLNLLINDGSTSNTCSGARILVTLINVLESIL